MNVNKDIKETIKLSALENLAERAGITRQQVKDAKLIYTVSNQDAVEKKMEEQASSIPMQMPPEQIRPPAQPMPSDPRRMAGVKAVQDALRTESQLDNLAMMRMRQAREGGMAYKGYSGMVPGEGHGMQDNVYMPIVEKQEGKQVATLAVSPDEYIVDAGTVAALGNGSSDAGAKVLDETIKDIRQEAYGTTKQQNQINGLASLQQAIQSNIG
jgi:hypothetical protein